MPRRRSAKRSVRRRSSKRRSARRSAKRSTQCRGWKWPWAFGAAKDEWKRLAKERAARKAESEKKRMAKNEQNEQNYKRTKGVLQESGFYA